MPNVEHCSHGALVALLLLGWLLVGLSACGIWSLSIGRWLHEAQRERDVGERAAAIAAHFRELVQRRARGECGEDGEAWTYEQAAEWWAAQARALGVQVESQSPAGRRPSHEAPDVTAVAPVRRSPSSEPPTLSTQPRSVRRSQSGRR